MRLLQLTMSCLRSLSDWLIFPFRRTYLLRTTFYETPRRLPTDLPHQLPPKPRLRQPIVLPEPPVQFLDLPVPCSKGWILQHPFGLMRIERKIDQEVTDTVETKTVSRVKARL